jgi:hypothetical protein
MVNKTSDEWVDLVKVIAAVIGSVGDELVEAWRRGVCDGLEMGAKVVEDAQYFPDPDAMRADVLAHVLREMQLRVQLDVEP